MCIRDRGTSLRSTRSKYIHIACETSVTPQPAASSIQNNRVCLGLALAFTRKTNSADNIRRNSITSLIRVSESERGTKAVAAICPKVKKATRAIHKLKGCRGSGIKMFARLFPWLKSVSYTHLDVYKRQVIKMSGASLAEDRHGRVTCDMASSCRKSPFF